MVAKIKSSFLKKNFQLFCYKHILSNPKSTSTNITTTPASEDSTAASISSFSQPSPNSDQNSQLHSKSSSNINTNKSEHAYNSQASAVTSNQVSKNDAMISANEPNSSAKYADPKLNYYYNNRKHLSKLLQSKKSSNGKLSYNNSTSGNNKPHIPNSNTLPIANSDLQLLADLKENLDLLKRHQKRSKSSINFATVNNNNKNYTSNIKMRRETSSENQEAKSNLRHSNPNIEIDFINYKIGNFVSDENEASQLKTNENLSENNKSLRTENMSSATSQTISSTPVANLHHGTHSSLYKNDHSIKSLKLAKKMQMMQKFKSENDCIDKQFLDGENFKINGNIFMSLLEFAKSN